MAEPTVRRPLPRAVSEPSTGPQRSGPRVGESDVLAALNPLDHPVCLSPPRRLSSVLSWHEHLPFAMFLIDLARPDARRASAPYVTMAAPRRNTPGSERFGKNGPRTMSRAAAPHRMRAIVRSTRCASSSSPSLTRRGDYPSASAMTPPTMRTAAIDLLPISASASVRAPMSTPMRIPISRAGAT